MKPITSPATEATAGIGFHDAANIFPLDEGHIDELAADIKANGQQVPIETLGGAIVDGRRRFLACQRAGVQPKFRAVDVADPIAYVVSLNLHRRHLNPSQLAMCASRATELYERQAKERQRLAGGDKKSAGAKSLRANLPEAIPVRSRDQAGKAFSVSGKSVDHARRVRQHAVPEVVKAVEEGRMAVSTAALLTVEPPEVQREEAAKPKRARVYKAVSSPPPTATQQGGREEETPGKLRGVGVIRAHEAINCLARIPKNDALRERGFQVVKDWIRRNP